jgi:hypothetical protein
MTCSCSSTLRRLRRPLRGCLVTRTGLDQAPRVQPAPVRLPAPPPQPGPARAKCPLRPDPGGTPELSVSAGPGSRGAAARARDLNPCTARARAISLGLPPLFPPLTAVYISLPPPPFSLGRHCFLSGTAGAPLYSLPLFFIDFSSIHGVLILSLLH